jgi:hypothetical protein
MRQIMEALPRVGLGLKTKLSIGLTTLAVANAAPAIANTDGTMDGNLSPSACRDDFMNNTPFVDSADISGNHTVLQGVNIPGVEPGCVGTANNDLRVQYRYGRRWENVSSTPYKVARSEGQGDYFKAMKILRMLRYTGRPARLVDFRSWDGSDSENDVPTDRRHPLVLINFHRTK